MFEMIASGKAYAAEERAPFVIGQREIGKLFHKLPYGKCGCPPQEEAGQKGFYFRISPRILSVCES